MRTVINRLRRLENAAAPAERERAAAEAILDARRRRLGADYVDPGSFAGCRTRADYIVRTRELIMVRQ